MKKVSLTLTLIAIAILALSGCGKAQQTAQSQNTTPTKQAKVVTDSKQTADTPASQTATTKTDTQSSNQPSADKTTVSTSNTSQSMATSQSEEQAKYAILQPITDNLRYAENKDIDGYMSTLAKAQQTSATKQSIEQMFKIATIHYAVVSKEVVSHTDTTATVKVVQNNIATKVADGYQYKNTQTTLQHQLVKEDGQWKIASTQALDVKELDENGNTVNQ